MKKASGYVRKVEKAQIFDNAFSAAFPQTDIAKICEAHIRSGERKKSFASRVRCGSRRCAFKHC